MTEYQCQLDIFLFGAMNLVFVILNKIFVAKVKVVLVN